MTTKTCCVDPRLGRLRSARDALRSQLHLIAPAARERWMLLEAALIALERQVAQEREWLRSDTLRNARRLTREFLELRPRAVA